MATTLAVIVVLVLLLGAAFAVVAARHRDSSGRLRRRFGPEYDLALAAHQGDEAATAEELTDRLDRYADLRPRPLAPDARAGLRAEWAEAQRGFVDSPAAAVTAATALVGRAARLRGFPDADTDANADANAARGADAQLAALSVHHPAHTPAYRESLALTSAADEGHEQAADTDVLRAQLLRLRDLFTELLAEDAAQDRPARALPRMRSGRRHPSAA